MKNDDGLSKNMVFPISRTAGTAFPGCTGSLYQPQPGMDSCEKIYLEHWQIKPRANEWDRIDLAKDGKGGVEPRGFNLSVNRIDVTLFFGAGIGRVIGQCPLSLSSRCWHTQARPHVGAVRAQQYPTHSIKLPGPLLYQPPVGSEDSGFPLSPFPSQSTLGIFCLTRL